MTQLSQDEFAASLSHYLEVIEERLMDAAVAQNPYTTAAARHVISAGGKRFRPALVVTAALCGDEIDQDRLVSAALVMELTHVASLYHDDVMDEADKRRGVPSANALYGNSIAILVGDFLFAQASTEVATLGVDYVDLQARTYAELVQGQIAETIGPDPDEEPIAHYLKVVEGKTASLIRTSAVFGGMVSHATPEVVDALAKYGYGIGMVFQLSDDLIDIVSDETGKTPGTDLREGIPTLPTLLLRASNHPADLALVARIDAGLSDDASVAEVVQELRVNPVIEQARAEVVRRAEQARSYLAPLPEGPAKQALSQLCDEVVTRSA